MANVNHGNTLYVDTIGNLTTQRTHVHQIIVTATLANAVVVLGNVTASEKQADLRVAAAGSTQTFEFEVPLIFPGGVKVLTLTNAIVTLVYNTR